MSINIIVRPRMTLLSYIFWYIQLFQGISASSLTRLSFMFPLILRTEVSVILYINQLHRINTHTLQWHNVLRGLNLKLILYPELKVYEFKKQYKGFYKQHRIIRSLAMAWEMDNVCSRFLLMHTPYHTSLTSISILHFMAHV